MQPAFKSFRQIVKTLLSYVLSLDILEVENLLALTLKECYQFVKLFFKKMIFLKKQKFKLI